MYYTGIDYHKRYSVVSIQDESDKIVLERQVMHNTQCGIMIPSAGVTPQATRFLGGLGSAPEIRLSESRRMGSGSRK